DAHSAATQAHIVNSSTFLNNASPSLGIDPRDVKEVTAVNAAAEEQNNPEVINITVTGSSPQLIARVPTGAAQRYVQRTHAAKLEAARARSQPSSPALRERQEQVGALRSKAAATPRTVEVETGEPNVERDRLQSRAHEVEAERMALQAKLARAERDLAPQSAR